MSLFARLFTYHTKHTHSAKRPMAHMALTFSLLLPMGFILPSVSYANTTSKQSSELSQLFNRLANKPMVRANFVQQKKLANVAKTFTSSGKIVFAKNSGVLWQIQSPVVADLIMTQKYAVQKTANTQSKISLEQNQYAGVANVFMQLMTGNIATLNQHFIINQINYSAQNWSLRLSPKSTTMKKLFAQVDISGNDYVQKIIIQEKATGNKEGSRTTIDFRKHSTSPAQLNAHEQALFNLAK